MNNSQKIAVIGSGLTGSVTSYLLAQLGFEIDLIDENFAENLKYQMQLSLSNNSLKQLEKFGVKNIKNKSCEVKNIFLYDSFYRINNKSDLTFSKSNQANLAYIVDSALLYKEVQKLIKKKKNISIIKKKFLSIDENNFNAQIIFDNKKCNKYSLIILTSKSAVKFFQKNKIDNLLSRSYKESSYIFTINHKKIINTSARQFFLKDGPLAFLPLSKNTTFVIWSIKKDSNWNQIINNKEKIINFLNLKFYKIFYKIFKISNINKFNLNFYLNNTKKLNRTILLGDALSQFHPIAGQAWNMTLRNIISLFNIIKDFHNIGFEIGGENFIKQYKEKVDSENFLFSILIHGIRKSFDVNDKQYFHLRKISENILDMNKLIKKSIINIADKGLFSSRFFF